jgi:hypothetical protein
MAFGVFMPWGWQAFNNAGAALELWTCFGWLFRFYNAMGMAGILFGGRRQDKAADLLWNGFWSFYAMGMAGIY